jgi:hypothetical protein
VHSKMKTTLALAALSAAPVLMVACGGSSNDVSKSSPTTGQAAPTTSTPDASTSTPSTQDPATTAPKPTGTASGLPTGAATHYVFGTTNDSGTQISLLPQNDRYVNQAAVAAAPKVGPFPINPSAGPSAWPDACTLTSLAQLKALDPAITGLSGNPVGTKATELGSGGNTPNNTDCKFNLTTTFDPSDESAGVPSYVDVSLQEVDSGTPTQYQQDQQQQAGSAAQYPAQYANYPNLPNRVSCFDNGNQLQCVKGDVYFWISGQKVTDGDKSGVDNAAWIEQIELPLAEVLGSELS